MRSIFVKLILAFVSVILFLVLLGTFAFHNTRKIADIHNQALESQINLKELSNRLSKNYLALYKLLGTMDPYEMDRLKSEYEQRLDILRREIEANGLDVELFDELVVVDREIMRLQYDFSVNTARNLLESQSKKLNERLLVMVEARYGVISTEARSRIDHTNRTALLLTILLTCGALIVSLGWAVFLMFSLTDRRRAEKALSKSRERLMMALDVSDANVWEMDLVKRVLIPDRRVLGPSISGEVGEEIPVDDLIALIHPDDVENTHKEMTAHLEGKKPVYHCEYRVKTFTGTWGWQSATGRVVERDEHGMPLRMIGTTMFITERKRTEEELRRLSAILEATSDLVSIATPDHRLVYLNHAGFRLLRWDEHEGIKDKTISDVHPKWALEVIAQEAFSTARQRGVWHGETAVVDNRGNEIPVSQVVIFHKSQHGELNYMSTIVRDISERKRAEKLIRESEGMLNSIIANIPDVIYRLDKDGNITYISDSIKRYGYSPMSLVGTSIFDLIHPDDRRRAEGKINDRRADNRRTRSLEIRFARNDDGSQVSESQGGRYSDSLFLVSAEGLYSGNPPTANTFIGTQGIARDITEHKRLEDQFSQSQKMESVGRLAGGIAHDFNNLLTVITGNAELAMMDMREDDALYESMSEIRGTAERASNLTRQLLAFSRRQMVEPRVVDINEILADMDKMLRRLITENIELVTLFSDTVWRVHIDPGQLEQVLTNLVVNARDAMPEGGTLIIETANVTLDEDYSDSTNSFKTGEYVMMAVSDTGTGMTGDILENIFEPFFTTKKKGQGTGLGLSTCYGIVRQNNGYIRAYSESGKGTTMKVYLPSTHQRAPEVASRAVSQELPGGTETILVAEDEPSVRRMVTRLLGNHGYTVLEAINGEEALRLLEKFSDGIQMVVTDVIMPKMGGKELSEKIFAGYPSIKVLFISGYTDHSIVHNGVLEPGLNFLQKPFTPSAFLNKVRNVIDGD